MSEFKEIFILLSLLIVPIGLSLFENVYSKWHKETDTVKRNKRSSLWHTIKYWMIVLTSLNIFYAYELTAWFRYLPLMMSVFMILFDLWWNWWNRSTIGSGWLFYPGNGKGGFIEGAVFWLSKRLGLNFTLTMIIVKIILLSISTYIITL